MTHYNPSNRDGKPVSNITPLEALIEAVHGVNAHDFIVPLLRDGKSHAEIATQINTPERGLSVSVSWVSWFVRRHYRKVSRWERVS